MEFLDTSFLESGEIKLVLERTAEENPVRNWVPAYYFLICDKEGRRMGACDLRVGYREGLYYGGHIGYAVDEAFRGHHYAAKACRLLFRLAEKHGMDHLFITCDPDNFASRRTCEALGGELLEIAELPEDNDMRVNDGDTHKCVYRFELKPLADERITNE
jgi:predicted acetyltransferase